MTEVKINIDCDLDEIDRKIKEFNESVDADKMNEEWDEEHIRYCLPGDYDIQFGQARRWTKDRSPKSSVRDIKFPKDDDRKKLLDQLGVGGSTLVNVFIKDEVFFVLEPGSTLEQREKILPTGIPKRFLSRIGDKERPFHTKFTVKNSRGMVFELAAGVIQANSEKI